MVAQTGNAYSETVLYSVHSPKGYVKQASARVAPPGYIQPKHRYKVSTVDAMMKHLVHKHDISVNEAGFNGVSVEILQQAAIVHGGTVPLCPGPQPHEEAMLQPFQSCKVGDRGSAPDHATALEDGPDVSIKRTQYRFVLESRSARTVWHLHAPHEKSKHPISFWYSRINMMTEREFRV